MSNKNWLTVLMAVCVCGALTGGCRTKSPKTDMGSEIPQTIDTTPLPLSGPFDTRPRADFKGENVLFDYDSFQIKPGEVAKIEKVAEYMKANTRVVLVAEGHCDERGSREYNMSLGEQRAGAVRAHLVGIGIAPDRIQTKSFGKEKPLNPGHGDAAWRENRRAEFAVYN